MLVTNNNGSRKNHHGPTKGAASSRGANVPEVSPAIAETAIAMGTTRFSESLTVTATLRLPATVLTGNVPLKRPRSSGDGDTSTANWAIDSQNARCGYTTDNHPCDLDRKPNRREEARGRGVLIVPKKRSKARRDHASTRQPPDGKP